MVVVSASTSPSSQGPVGFAENWITRQRFPIRKTLVLAFKTDGKRSPGFLKAQEPIALPVEVAKEPQNVSKRKGKKPAVNAVSVDEAPSCNLDLEDYSAAAATLESIYKLSPGNLKEDAGPVRRGRRTRKNEDDTVVMRNTRRKSARLNLDNRIALRKIRAEAAASAQNSQVTGGGDFDVQRLVRDYAESTPFISFDWAKQTLPAVLSSAEHKWLFSLIQPMKAIELKAQELLQHYPSRQPSDEQLAVALKTTTSEIRRLMEVGQAARSKLVTHNLRLVLFVINKHYKSFRTDTNFQLMCQAGIQGLITSINKFDPNRGHRLSTYSTLWIRSAVSRSLASSSDYVADGSDLVRRKINKARSELTSELGRTPTDDEIIERTGISEERYHHHILRAPKLVSLDSTQGESELDKLAIAESIEEDERTTGELVRLAIDDVLDSLKPKESLVIRQRYGLDGKGNRSLGEIAANLNISREMVRKYEVKAMMKLKHPDRLEYLRSHIF